MSYCRIDAAPIRRHDPVVEADAVVVQDPTLLHDPTLLAGLHPYGYLLVNTRRSIEELGLGDLASTLARDRLLNVAATDLAMEVIGRPLPNTVLLGGLAQMTGVVTVDAVEAAIRRRFTGPVAEANVVAARRAAQFVAEEMEALSRA